MELVLASGSPRRAELLERLGLTFEVIPARIPEELLEDETPGEHTERLSREKALEVCRSRPDSLVLAGDTVVVLDDRVLGKPSDPGDAVDMLTALSGRTHLVVSGVALVCPDGRIRSDSETVEVTFRELDRREILRYVETGEPMDKAGSYGIQGLGSALVRRIRGDYPAVVGLAVPLFLDLLEELGIRYDFGRLLAVEEEA